MYYIQFLLWWLFCLGFGDIKVVYQVVIGGLCSYDLCEEL